MKKESKNKTKNPRREFIRNAALTSAGFYIVPRHVLGRGFTAPSDTLYIATIGAGGKGTSDCAGFMRRWDEEKKAFVPQEKAKIAFLCDVDQLKGATTFNRYPDAKVYEDWRVLIEKEHKNFDAVSVSTPDHTHAVAASAAITHGKHIWVQKPMTNDIYEARVLAKLAREHKVVSQMGNQGSSNDGVRQMREWYEAGLIGDVTDVYCYTNRPVWPQGGMKWPTKTGTPPSTFNWDLWQGSAKAKPFPSGRTGQQRNGMTAGLAYEDDFHLAPHDWRGWWDYGTGVIGDMGAHILEAPMTVLDLGYVSAVQTSLGNPSMGLKQEEFPDTCPPSSNTILTFPNPKKGKHGKTLPNIRIHWMDGGLTPPRPEEMEPTDTLALSDGSGMLFIGTKGKMIAGCYSAGARLLPVSRMEEAAIKKLPVKYPRVPGGAEAHYQQWVEACLKGYEKGETSSNFDKAAKVVENMLVANLAIRGYNIERKTSATTVAATAAAAPNPPSAGAAGATQRVRPPQRVFPARNITLLWDHDQMKITNCDEVNQFVQREYREGFGLSGV